jgi:beta-N-acetylhexosaminidase
VVRLLASATGAGKGDVVVALDAPYGLGRSTGSAARIALYGRTPEAFAALVDVLTGEASAPGRLPVAVKGLPARAGCR